MRVNTLVMLKDLGAAKSRLSEALSQSERSALAAAMAQDVLSAVNACDAIDVVYALVGGDDAARLCAASGARVIADTSLPGPDNNARFAKWLSNQGADDAPVVVLHADLPMLTGDDILALIGGWAPDTIAMAPDRARSGTNALIVSPRQLESFTWGVDSRARFHALAAKHGLFVNECQRDGLATDVDVPDDLMQLSRRLASGKLPAGQSAKLLSNPQFARGRFYIRSAAEHG